MRPVLKYALLLVSLAALVAAVETEEQTLSFTVSEVPGLITVSTDVNTTNLLPGFEYNYILTVDWAVPEDSLRAIETDEITLYVRVKHVENNTAIYFKQDNGTIIGERFVTLSCAVANHSCSNESALSKSMRVYYMLQPAGNVSLEQLIVSASLKPFSDNATVDEVNSLIARLSTENLTVVTGLPERFDNARELADEGDYETALLELREIGSTAGAALAATPTPTPSGGFGGIEGWAVLAVLLVILFGLLAAFYLGRGKKKPRKGFEGLGEDEVRGKDYKDEPPGTPEGLEYKAPEEKAPGDAPIVQRVPDWMG